MSIEYFRMGPSFEIRSVLVSWSGRNKVPHAVEFLVVQWVYLRALTAEGPGLIPSWELRSHKPHGAAKNKEVKTLMYHTPSGFNDRNLLFWSLEAKKPKSGGWQSWFFQRVVRGSLFLAALLGSVALRCSLACRGCSVSSHPFLSVCVSLSVQVSHF